MSKKFKFVNENAKRAFMDLPTDIRINFSGEIRRVQDGDDPLDDFKVLRGEWKGVIQLRENGSLAHRAVYCAKYLNTVYILHAFTKTSEKADQNEMDTALSRYKEMVAEVREVTQSEAKAAKDKKTTKKLHSEFGARRGPAMRLLFVFLQHGKPRDDCHQATA